MPFWLQITLGITSALSPVALFLCSLMVQWIRGIQKEIGDQAKEIATLRSHMAENYVRGPEVERITNEVSGLRHTVEEAVKLLYEIKGAQQPIRG